MFDKDNPTIEEEILQEGLTEVLLKPKVASHLLQTKKKDSDDDMEEKEEKEPGSPKFGAVSLEETKDNKTEVSESDTPTFIDGGK